MAEQKVEQKWLPLESNPDVMNKYVRALGVPGCTEFHDVYGLDEEMLAIVPRPVYAVVLLYPLTDKVEETPLGDEDSTSDLYYIKQTISNACGTIGLIHAVANNQKEMDIGDGKHLSKFLELTKGMTPEERAKHLEEDTEFGAAHEESAQEGQTQPPPRDEKLTLHFVTFVHSNGGLYELDGRKSAPVRHGDATPDNLLEKTAEVVKKFMARDPEEVNFTVVALVKSG